MNATRRVFLTNHERGCLNYSSYRGLTPGRLSDGRSRARSTPSPSPGVSTVGALPKRLITLKALAAEG